MKRKQMLVLAFAVICGLLAMLGMRSIMSKPAQKVIVDTKQIDTIDVLVAKQQIGLGDSIKAGDMQWMGWPRAGVTNGYVTRQNNPKAIEQFVGAIARAPFLQGEPIKEQKLIKAADGGVMAAILPAGMRAISTPIREETAAGGFILPNDRVDVVLTRKLRSRNGGEDYVSDTLFRDVRILAIGQLIEMKEGKKVAEGKTATLELNPQQSEQLALARSMGEISLALRSIAEKTEGNPTTNSDSLRKENGRGNSISVLRYGVKSRAFGVN